MNYISNAGPIFSALSKIAFRRRAFPAYFIYEVLIAEDSIQNYAQVMTRRRVTMQIEATSRFENAMKLDEARRHHREIRHHW